MKDEDYISSYQWILLILGIIIFVGGIIAGQENINIMFYCWIGGAIFLFFINMIKDILKELREINNKLNYHIEKNREVEKSAERQLENENNKELNDLINKLVK